MALMALLGQAAAEGGSVRVKAEESELLEQAGFADYSSFFRAFKREYGIAPSQFRDPQAGHESRAAKLSGL